MQLGLDAERYSVHKLRHTAATLMYKHGNVDIRSQQILDMKALPQQRYTLMLTMNSLKMHDNNPLSEITLTMRNLKIYINLLFFFAFIKKMSYIILYI